MRKDHWIASIVVALGVLYIFGFLISAIRKQPIQRTWVLTLCPFSTLLFMIIMDGMFLEGPGLEITKMVALMSIIFGCFWYITNWLDKKVGSISLKKGDAELRIGGHEPQKEGSNNDPDPE